MSSTMVTSDRLDYQRGSESEPLTDRDVELIHRYLSDPSVFPREFKNWVTEHSSDTVDIAKTQVHGLVNNAGQLVLGNASMKIMGLVMVGVVIPFAATLPPEGWLLCDGSEKLRSDYATLFSTIGTSWGSPSDATKFKLPDLRGRTPYGADANVPFAGDDGRPVGTRGPRHYHHFVNTASFAAGGPNTYDGSAWGTVDGNGNHNHSYTQPAYFSEKVYAAGDAARNIMGGATGMTTGDGGWHDHWANLSAQVSGWTNVSGSVSIDANIGDAAGPEDTVGWAGLNYIIGSGTAP